MKSTTNSTYRYNGQRLASRLLSVVVGAGIVLGLVLYGLIFHIPHLPVSTGHLDRKRFDQQVLALSATYTYRIAIFSDLHYGEEENGWGIDQDVNTTGVINKVLDAEKPDLVILNGDLITGENTFLHNATKYLDQIVQPMSQRNIPWASTYGNHDEQFNLSREHLFQEESKYQLSRTQHSPPGSDGVTNYYLPIFTPDHSESPAMILWFFDSRGGHSFQDVQKPVERPDWVSKADVKWFKETKHALTKKYGKLPPSLAFVHIPPTSFLDAQKLYGKDPLRRQHYPGLNDDSPVSNQGDGSQDKPFVNALRDTPGLHSVYSGHDHGDSWCMTWPESDRKKNLSRPHLCFCKHTGYGGYGSWNRGSRILELSFNPKEFNMDVETWVRMEDGTVIQHVSLNETYGQDMYSSCDGEQSSCL